MEFRQWDADEDLEMSSYRMMQPKTLSHVIIPDVVMLPLLAFDACGNRLGQGGGHYDRFLAQNSNVYKIGLAYDVQEVLNLPTEPHDITLNAIWTEKNWRIITSA
jgi:5-formyltetrahydrofolate cyclo-ligase